MSALRRQSVAMARPGTGLTPELICRAYAEGYFPMAGRRGRIYWYRPDPRTVIPLRSGLLAAERMIGARADATFGGLHVSRSLRKTLRRRAFEIRIDTAFEEVMRSCADRAEGSWISEEFVEVYTALHRLGAAHSVEVWLGDALVGGLYGVALGGAFMAESMYHRVTDTSKVALAATVRRLIDRGFTVLDTQYLTSHLQSLGAVEIPAYVYDAALIEALALGPRFYDAAREGPSAGYADTLLL